MEKQGLKISALNLRLLGTRRRSSVDRYVTVTRLGHIDKAADGVIVGWVKDEDSEAPLVIDILLDGVEVKAGIVADLHRQDVQDAGFGNGHFGFECGLPEAHLPVRKGAVIEVRRSPSGEILLRHVVSSLQRAASPTSVEDVASKEIAGQLEPEGSKGHRHAVEPKELKPSPAVVSFDCRAKIESVTLTELRGWAINENANGQTFNIDVLIDGQEFCVARNDQSRGDLLKHRVSKGLGGIRVALPLRYLEAGEHTISLRLPDGRVCSETVFVDETARRHPLNEGVASIPLSDVAVIVPVYNAAEDVAVCIERLATFTPRSVEILFIDDASPDPAISGLMQRAASHPNMRVLQNPGNMGFTRTVNRGLEDVGRKHAILLNSDARVTPGWLQGMLMAAASRPRVATVTAMSDRAGAFSAPAIGNANELPPGVDEITYARAFRRRALGIYPDVPTGNGFCMFVNRACLDEVGPLDAEAFPRGYGEENDFCMRAGRAGWAHLVDDRTYVFHDRSKSFGAAKTDLMAAGRAVIDARYPEYKQAIRVFSTDTDLQLARFRARQAMADCADPRAGLPAVLFVVATQTGGTPQTNLDLMTALADGLDSWLLRCDSRELILSRLEGSKLREVRRHRLDKPVDPIRHHSGEYDAVVRNWIREIAPRIVHIRHLGWHSLSLPRIAKDLGSAVVFSFHDFYTLCPSVKLLDGDNNYCGGTCTASAGECRAELWPQGSLPPLKGNWVHVWRQRFDKVLSDCDAFVTTSDSARTRILSQLPGIDAARFHVIPHGRSFTEMQQFRQRPRHGSPLKILVPGNISLAKGLGVIKALLDHDTAGLIEFHVLGKIDTTQGISHPRLVLHGTYARDDFAKRAEAAGAHLGAVFSIWDETYCHTLTELWAAGFPALVFDFPTVAGRVRESGAGWVLPHEDIPELYARILALAFDEADQSRADTAILRWQGGRGQGRTTQLMAAHYLDVYRQATGRTGRHPIVAVVAPGSEKLHRGYASTEIRLWERTRNSLGREVTYVRMTPAALLANIRDKVVDGAIIQRNAIPLTMVEPLLGAFRDSGLSYVLDLDDDLLDVPADKDPSGAYRAYAPFLRRLAEHARLVTVSTAPLSERLRRINPYTHLLPNRLSEPLWRGDLPPRAADGRITALYMGSKTHRTDFDMIAPALERIAARNADFRLAVIGVHDAPLPDWAERIEVPDHAKSYASFVPWLKSLSPRFDFALAPLEDTEFNRHKSALKVLDGAALGLPVLASDMPVYRALRGDVPEMMLVGNTTEDWVIALEAAVAQARSGGVDRVGIRRLVLNRYGLVRSLPDYDSTIKMTVDVSGGMA